MAGFDVFRENAESRKSALFEESNPIPKRMIWEARQKCRARGEIHCFLPSLDVTIVASSSFFWNSLMVLDHLGITVFRQNRPVFDKNRLESSNSPRARFFWARAKCRESAPKLHFSNMPRLPAMVFGTLRRNGKATENVKKMRVFAIPNEK